MKKTISVWGLCLWTVIGLVITVRAAAPADGILSDLRMAHARVSDLVMEVERKEVQEDELQRLNRSGSSVLEFSRMKVYFKAPDRLRMEGRRGMVPITMVESGNQQTIRLALGIKKRLDLSGNPRRKQGGLEFGLLSDQVWQDYHVTQVGTETWEGHRALVLQLKVHGDPTGGYHKLWVDAETFRVLRRDRLTGDGKLKFRQVFRQPVRSPAGTWLSRRIEIYNQHSQFVGALETRETRVNQGIGESLFRL